MLSKDAWFAAALTVVGVEIEPLVGRHIDDGIAVEMQLDVTLQTDGACEPHTLWHDKTSSALCGETADGFLEGFGIQCHTVANASKLFQVHLIVGNQDVLYGFDVNVQALIVTGIVLGGLQRVSIVFCLSSIIAGELVEVVTAQVRPLIVRILRSGDGHRYLAFVQQSLDEDVILSGER